jgi:uncharacterized protein
MLIRVRELEIHKLEFDEEYQPGAIEFGQEFRQVGVLHTQGRAELLVEHRGHHQDVEDIRLVGNVEAHLEFSCARCLEPVGHEVNWNFDLIYRPLGVDRRKDEVAISQAETEIGYYDGEELLLEDTLREQVLLATPVRALCREDCKGLCLQCGCNLNVGQCHCAQPVREPRWEALSGIKKKLQG